MNTIKRLALMLTLMAVTAVSSLAITIEDAWVTVKTMSEFSPMQVPAEDARQQGFDSLSVALSETVSPEALTRLSDLAANIPQTEQITVVSQGDQHVWIYARPITGDKVLLLIMVVNGKQGVVVNGICPKKMLDDQLSGLHLNNIFGK